MTQERTVALDICIWAALDLEFLHGLNFPLKRFKQMAQMAQMVQAKQIDSLKLVSSLHCYSSQLRLQYLLGSSISLSAAEWWWYQDSALDSCWTKQETS